jgi:hypothetical protein
MHPFNDPSVACAIPLGAIEAPYGPKYDRHDLSETVTGVLGDSTPEELLSLLIRHTGSAPIARMGRRRKHRDDGRLCA